MATLIQLMQNFLSQKDFLLSNETRRVMLKEFLPAEFVTCQPVQADAGFCCFQC
jgi:hypothetical protein